ncbi:cyclin-D3-1-like [Solanum pennellii]|uniref:Cyclin-D3-1-like n=1 Tax=Solanum pennellii TaxID=28526 RepID=A0ABM1GLC4_SOLPN|nr:cyclin-D3-1-like [Solanum pennellii]
MAEEDWGDIFTNLRMSACRGRLQLFARQFFAEKIIDIGEDNEDYVENMLKEEEKIAIAGLTNTLPLRTLSLPWLPKARRTAIYNIVSFGGSLGVRKITIYAAVIYVDRFLSLVPKKRKISRIAVLLAYACLYLAFEEHEDYRGLLVSVDSRSYTESIMNLKSSVVTQFGGIVNFVTPIQFIKFFLSKLCKDFSRKEYARIKTVEVIMSTIGDVRLMSVRAFVIGAAATLLASNSNILTHEMIKDEINALPKRWLIPIDEMCSCYDSLLETNRHRLDIS